MSLQPTASCSRRTLSGPFLRTVSVFAMALAMVVCFLGLASTASGATLYYHPVLGSFGPKGPESSAKFTSPTAIAVDQGSHDVYVLDFVKEGEHAETWLYRFTATGAPKPFTAGPGSGTNHIALLTWPHIPMGGAVAVAPPGAPGGTEGDIYVIDGSEVDGGGKVEVYSPDGEHLGTIDGSGNPNPGGNGAAFVTVDGGGHLYIGYHAVGLLGGHIDKYVPSADPPSNSDFDSELRFENQDVLNAAISSTALYVSAGLATRYLPSFPGGKGSTVPTPAYSFRTKGPLAVDPSTGDLYNTSILGEQRGVEQINDAGNPVSFIPVATSDLSIFGDLDVDGSTGQVFIPIMLSGDSRPRVVGIFGAGQAVQSPTAALDPVTAVHFNSAEFSGTVNTGTSGPLQETEYRFECSKVGGGACSTSSPWRTIPGDGSDHEVTDTAPELQPETEYTVSLVARNVNFPAGFAPAESVSTATFKTPAKPAATVPQVTIDPVTSVDSTSAQVTGTVDPGGSGPYQATTYRFEYSVDGIHWQQGADQGPVEGGSQQVEGALTELSPNTEYQVRLQAENVAGEATSAPPNPSFITDAVAPLVEITGATKVLAGSAQLNARINPLNSHTSYYFEWGVSDCASNPCASVPAGRNGDAGNAGEFGWVAASVSGLAPGQEYSYRLVAKNTAGESVSESRSFTTQNVLSECPNASQRTGYSAALPDCRAYEMVSPVDKGGGSVAMEPVKTRVAADGSAVTFRSTSAFAGALGAPWSNVEYISTREADGWKTHAISPYQKTPYRYPEHVYTSPGYTGRFSSTLDTGVYRAFAPIPGATSANVANVANLYLATGLRTGQPHFQLLSDSESPLTSNFEEESAPYLTFDGASDGFRKVVFESRENLTADASGTNGKVYEWDEGTLRLAGILPDADCASPPCPAAATVGGAGGIISSPPNISGTETGADNVVSDDGSKVFFTAGAMALSGSEGGPVTGPIYARLNGRSTVQIDASEQTVPGKSGSGHSQFGAATPDGTVVYFTSEGPLVDDPHGSNLYQYDFEKPAGHRLTAIHLPGGARAQEIEGISRSGDFVYVWSSGALYSGNGRLYGIHNGHAFLVASFEGRDLSLVPTTGADQWSFRMSPDGGHVIFTTSDDVTGYDSSSEACSYVTDECSQVYLYSYDSGDLVCASCNIGHSPLGEAFYSNGRNNHFTPDVGLWAATDSNLNTPLSADGRFVFFSSPEPLDPHDSNGRYDAYVYDSVTGQARLLSSGQCACDSFFISASPDGHDAFFTTNQQLVGIDRDTGADLYDARIGGGIAAQNSTPPAECQGDACQAAPTPPNDPTPASASFLGAGNGAHRMHGKVKRHRRKHHRRHRAGPRPKHRNKQGSAK